MIEVRPFLPPDLTLIDVQPRQRKGLNSVSPEGAARLVDGEAYSLWAEGRPVVIVGIVQIWEGRQMAWGFLARDIKRHMISVHRAVKRLLEQHADRRVEISVACDFEEGHRWARLLGFEKETARMKSYSRLGEDHALYARVQ